MNNRGQPKMILILKLMKILKRQLQLWYLWTYSWNEIERNHKKESIFTSFVFPSLSPYVDPRAKKFFKHPHTKTLKCKILKFKNSLDFIKSRIKMKKEMVSELEDKAIEIIFSVLQTGFFFNEQISKTCGTTPKGQTFVSLDSWRERR